MKRLQNRPTNTTSIEQINRELEKIYDLINNLSLSISTYDDSKSNKGRVGSMRVSRNSNGNVVLEIKAGDDWYSSTEIFSKLKA